MRTKKEINSFFFLLYDNAYSSLCLYAIKYKMNKWDGGGVRVINRLSLSLSVSKALNKMNILKEKE